MKNALKRIILMLLTIALLIGEIGLPISESDWTITASAWADELDENDQDNDNDPVDSPVIPPHTHEGGEATCMEPAICDICGEYYGEPNPDNHAWGEWIDGEQQGDEIRQYRVCELNEEHVEERYVAAPAPAPAAPAVGETYLVGGRKYLILPGGKVKLVAVSAAERKKKTITIQSTVRIGGVTFRITEIGPKAFANCKKLRKLKITGKYIEKIDKKAFSKLSKSKISVSVSKKSYSASKFKTLKKYLVKAGIKSKHIKTMS